MNDNQRFFDYLEKKAKELCPDYPFDEKFDKFDSLWAITSALEGTTQANEDWHRFAKKIAKKFGLNDQELFNLIEEEWRTNNA